MANDLPDTERQAWEFLDDKLTRSVLDTCLRKFKDSRESEKILRYENWLLRLHADHLDAELKKSQGKLEKLQEKILLEKKELSFKDKLRARILRTAEKLSGNGFCGGLKKWRLYSRAPKELVFSEGFFRYLALTKAAKELTFAGDTGLRLPKGLPLTTVIVAATGDGSLTGRFLATLYKSAPQAPFEVIVTGAFGKNEAASGAANFPGVRFVKASDTQTLLESARGEYLFFADDRMILLPGALDELASALFRHPEAGAIGGNIFHGLSGELLESGSLVCRNGELLSEGVNCPADESRISFFRECDLFLYSGFITSKESFAQISLPGPADRDARALCSAKLRTNGRVNFVMPLARILCTNELTESFSANEELRNTFAPLTQSALYDTPEQWQQERRFPKPAVLYIDAELPRADRGSGGMDVIFFVEYMLKRGHQVLFFGENDPCFVPKYTPILQRIGVECFCRKQQYLEEFLKAHGSWFHFAFLARVYQARNFDSFVRRYMPSATVIFNTVDVHFVRERLEAELENTDEKRLKAMFTEQTELTVMARSDAVIVISSDEKKMLQECYGVDNCWHIPQAREINGRTNPAEKRSGMVFIGSAHPPNLDGLKYYVEEILPLLKQKNPGRDLTLTVIGEALRNDLMAREDMEVVTKCPHISFAGFVEDLGDYLNDARLTIAPLRYGAGTKGKVASSMSYGVPCVSSPFGTEGTGMIHGENILVARTPEDFAESVTRLLEDNELWQTISDGGLKFLRDNYSTETVDRKMDELWQAAQVCNMMRQSIWHPCSAGEWSKLCSAPQQKAELLQALGTLLRCKGAAVFYEGESSDFTQADIFCPRCKCGGSILEENSDFDFIILSEAPGSDPLSKLRLSFAAMLCHNGGRIILPLPQEGAGELYSFLQQELKIQQIFYSTQYKCLCLSKALPSPERYE